MKAIPTLYKGIRFRSRLEARWAAYFDLLNEKQANSACPDDLTIPWLYEPIDLNGWIPDFSRNQQGFVQLCEVKPLFEINKFKQTIDWAKITKAFGPLPNPHREFDSLAILGVHPRYAWVFWHDWSKPWQGNTEINEHLWAVAGNTVQWKAPS